MVVKKLISFWVSAYFQHLLGSFVGKINPPMDERKKKQSLDQWLTGLLGEKLDEGMPALETLIFQFHVIRG